MSQCLMLMRLHAWMCALVSSGVHVCACTHITYGPSAFESRHACLCCMCTHAFLYSRAHVFVLRGLVSSPRLVMCTRSAKGSLFWFTGKSVGKATHTAHRQSRLSDEDKNSEMRHLRVKTILMCGLITADSIKQSHSNYALIILREFRSRRTLWKSVYPAAE